MISVKFILRSRAMSNGEHKIYFQITHNGVQKRISMDLSCKKSQWGGNEFKSNHPNYVKRNIFLSNEKKRALSIIDQFNTDEVEFCIDRFERVFKREERPQTTVFELWGNKIQSLNKIGKVGNAKVYKCTKSSFFKFTDNKKLLFRQITPRLLNDYEDYLRVSGNSNSGISVKMRTLRSLYNIAIDDEIVDLKHYPFKKYSISKLKSSPDKRALSVKELRLFKGFDVSNYPDLRNAYNYFMFSFYCRGINFKDLIQLKWNNINNCVLSYTRSKTGKRFVLELLPPANQILEFYKNVNNNTDFIFPILSSDDLTPQQILDRRDRYLKIYNSQLKEIASKVGIRADLTSYVARHSYATFLKKNNVSIELISESMGHVNVDVTKSYLSDFGDQVLNSANKKLLDL